MIRGYISSDEEEDCDDFYSEPPVKGKDVSTFPLIQNAYIREELHSALEQTKKVSLFLAAVDRSDLTTLKELISLGACVNSAPFQQWTPLLRACSLGYPEVVEFLLEHDANPNLQKELFSPLMACCTNTYVSEDLKLSCVRLLIQHGANVNLKDKYRMTALMYATENSYKDIVNELLSLPNIDVNLQDKEGSTALFYAVKNNDCILVQKLIDNGTDVKLKDRNDRTALNVALLNDFVDIAKILGYKKENQAVEFKERNKTLSPDIVTDFLLFDEDMFSFDTDSIFAAWNEFVFRKKVSFPKFLNMTAKDLLDNGIIFEHDRCKILKNIIHKYHLHPWKKSSMPEINGNNVEIHDLAALTANIMKHLVIGNASLQYINSRISKNLEGNLKDVSVVKELIIVLKNIYSTSNQLKFLFFKILDHSKKVKICMKDDFVGPLDEQAYIVKNFVNFKYFSYVISATTASYFLYHYYIK